MPVQKKIPLRQCLGCREMKPKKELVRVVRSPEGQISLDFMLTFIQSAYWMIIIVLRSAEL